MSEEDFLKAIKLSKEELIEWLNEQYHQEKRLKEIINLYEIKSHAHKERQAFKTKNLEGKDEFHIEEIVITEINGDIIRYKNYSI